jgi:hypothetical protein
MALKIVDELSSAECQNRPHLKTLHPARHAARYGETDDKTEEVI